MCLVQKSLSAGALTMLLTMLSVTAVRSAEATAKSSRLSYPTAPRADQVDKYHGVAVEDPYRWLEDLGSDETRAWVEAENKLTASILDEVPAREAIRRRLTTLWNYPRYGVPIKRGGRYFYSKNNGLQNQSVIYWATRLHAEPKVLIDPNALSPDGTIAITNYQISDNGQFMAYGLATAGSDWQEWHVRDVASGKELADKLEWIKFSSASWTPDNKGFFYSRYDEPTEETKLVGTNYYPKVYYHRIGTLQTEDRLVYERRDQKEWGFDAEASEDGRYVIISVRQGSDPNSAIFYQRLDDPKLQTVELLANFDAQYVYLGNEGSVFWFRTDLDAPSGRVIAIDVEKPERANWRELIGESESLLEEASVVGDRFCLSYLKDAHSQVKVFDLTGRWQSDIALPGLGTAFGFDGRRKDQETFYAFTGFTAPTTIYRYELASRQSEVYQRPKVDFNPDDFETRQVFYTSRDGTRVPMFISHRKGLKLDGRNPTLLNGYGGFNVSLTPYFSVSNLVWMELGGVYAVPNLRGGGEYGREWHQSGTKLRKQNVFDDFIAAAEWLIAQKYTSPEKLAISGRSNGGLLVGACLTQRPELFGAALPGVGVLDMLRFHKFTIGWAWMSDYGSADNPEEFAALRAYSPLHNITPSKHYPSTLITTADHDDRVVPGHSYKFAAALQAAQSGPAPILIRIETKAGHGAGKPITKLIENATDQLTFLVFALKVDMPANH
jgi:prolyl oligopeptidase